MTPMDSPLPVDIVEGSADWVLLGATILASVATLAAVVVAIWQTAIAREDARQARMDAAEAREDAHKETELRLQSERDHRASANRAEAERRAARQARNVRVSSGWSPLADGTMVNSDLHANVFAVVYNDSLKPISEVEVWHYPRVGLETVSHAIVLFSEGGSIRANDSEKFGGSRRTYVGNLSPQEELVFVVEFTDAYADRWRLDWDGTLTLLTRRRIEMAAEDGGARSALDDSESATPFPRLPLHLPRSHQGTSGVRSMW